MAASRGLGYMIQFNTNQFDTIGAVSGILVLMVCVMLFNGVLNRLESYVLRWRPKERAVAALAIWLRPRQQCPRRPGP